MAYALLNLGDVVKLKKPFHDYTHGIVVEVTATFNLNLSVAKVETPEVKGVIGAASYAKVEGEIPRNVSLFLYKPAGKRDKHTTLQGEEIGELYLSPCNAIPEYVDFHIRELILIKRSSELGYAALNTDLEQEIKRLGGEMF